MQICKIFMCVWGVGELVRGGVCVVGGGSIDGDG